MGQDFDSLDDVIDQDHTPVPSQTMHVIGFHR